MSYSDFLEDALLDHWIGNDPYVAPATIYVSVSTTPYGEDGSGATEPVGNGYARVAVTNNLIEWPASSGGSKSNANAIQFPTATGAWGTLTDFGLYDQAVGGNFLGSNALTASRTIGANDTLSFAAGNLTVTLD